MRALTMLEQGHLCPPAALVAGLQTAGRGRGTNRWWSDRGSLCATFVMPVDPTIPVGQVPLRAGLAVAETLSHYLQTPRPQVKWPNDILIQGRKVGGILCARVRGADVIGIGLNVATDLRNAPPDVRREGGSLNEYLRVVPRRATLLVELWRAVLETRTAQDWLTRYRHRHALDGRVVVANVGDHCVRGRCVGLDYEGRLLLEIDGQRRPITEATVQWPARRRPLRRRGGVRKVLGRRRAYDI